ncbi:MAG: hypothetical protein V4772_00735 [Pseudomonadota bacterium]
MGRDAQKALQGLIRGCHFELLLFSIQSACDQQKDLEIKMKQRFVTAALAAGLGI